MHSSLTPIANLASRQHRPVNLDASIINQAQRIISHLTGLVDADAVMANVPYRTGERPRKGVSSSNEARPTCYALHKMWRRWLQHTGRRRSLQQKFRRATLRRHKRDGHQETRLGRMPELPGNRILPQQGMPGLQRCGPSIRGSDGCSNGLNASAFSTLLDCTGWNLSRLSERPRSRCCEGMAGEGEEIRSRCAKNNPA